MIKQANIYQARNGYIYLDITGSDHPVQLNLDAIENLRISLRDLEDFDYDHYLEVYSPKGVAVN